MSFFKKRIITLTIILTNVIIFFIYQDDFNVVRLLNQGALFAPYVLDGDYWRIVSSMFLHGGLLHLAMNMVALYLIGSAIENEIGPAYFGILYMMSGILAAYGSLSFNLFAVSVGASGAIFGLYAFDLLTVLLRSNKKQRFAVLLNFLIYTLVIYFLGEQFNFDQYAHIGGFFSGAIIYLFYRYDPRLAVSSILFIFLFLFIPNYQLHYYNFFQFFISKDQILEEQMNSSFSSEKDFAEKIQGYKELPAEILNRLDTVPYIPEELSQDTTTIRRYLSIKKDIIDYILTGFSKESMIYYDSIYSSIAKLNEMPPINYNLNFSDNMPPGDTSLAPQKNDSIVKVYYDKNWVETNQSLLADYYRIGYVDSLGDWHGEVYDYYKYGNIQMKGRYSHGLKDGVFLYYTEENEYEAAGRYREDLKVGKWENFHSGNILASEIRYTSEGVRYENLYDRDGRKVVKDGYGTYTDYYKNGALKAEENYENFELINATGFLPDGTIHYREVYEDNTLIKGVSLHQDQTHYYDFSTYIPYPPGGFAKFEKYVSSLNTLSTDSANIRLVLFFDVTAEGEVHNIRFKERVGDPYDSFGKNVFKNGPEWIPAKEHGYKPIPSSHYFEIFF